MSVTVDPRIDQLRGEYRRAVLNRLVCIASIGLLLASLTIADLLLGPSGLAPGQIWATLIAGPAGPDRLNSTILWQLRLPQSLTGMAVGACLGLAGLQMQTILDNPLASPFTLGFSAAAGFGAALAISLHGLIALPLAITTPLLSFAMTLVACGLIYLVATLRGASAGILVLAGIAVMFFFQSLLALMQFLASPEVLQQIVFWLFGSLLKASWTSVTVIGAVLAIGLPVTLLDAWRLTALRLGDANAASLGIPVAALRRRAFAMVALLTAAAVSFVGTIGFIGLIAPHMARRLVGEDHRFALPLSALCGAVLLMAASVIGKLIAPGGALPVGIVTAIAGVPVLFALILGQAPAREPRAGSHPGDRP